MTRECHVRFWESAEVRFLCATRPPMLMLYGEQMPDFLDSFEPVQKYPYLSDLARLELALIQSYHAADSQPIDPAVLQTLPPEELMAMSVTLAPSVRLIRSQWPIFQLWRFNTEPDTPQPQPGAEAIVVGRVEFDPVPKLLPSGGGAFVQALLEGQNFSDAIDQGNNEASDHDLARTLSTLIEGNAITALNKG